MRTAIAVLGIAAAGVAGGQNLLSNAGFESDINFDGNASGNWNAFFGDFGNGMSFLESTVAMDNPNSGAQHYRGTVTGGAGAAFTGIEQRVGGIAAGAEYTFSFFGATNGQNSNVTEFRIEWEDAMGNDIGDFLANTEAASLTTDYQMFSQSRVAPDGAAFAVLVVAIQSFGGAVPADQVSFIDDASFIPAPAGLAVLGMGGLMAAGRRRK